MVSVSPGGPHFLRGDFKKKEAHNEHCSSLSVLSAGTVCLVRSLEPPGFLSVLFRASRWAPDLLSPEGRVLCPAQTSSAVAKDRVVARQQAGSLSDPPCCHALGS